MCSWLSTALQLGRFGAQPWVAHASPRYNSQRLLEVSRICHGDGERAGFYHIGDPAMPMTPEQARSSQPLSICRQRL